MINLIAAWSCLFGTALSLLAGNNGIALATAVLGTLNYIIWETRSKK